MDPLLIPFGFGVGFLVGMTGMGGGSLMTPLLILVFGTSPVTAVGSDITYAAVTKTVGGWRHLRLRTVNLALSFWLALRQRPGRDRRRLGDRVAARPLRRLARRHRADDARDRADRGRACSCWCERCSCAAAQAREREYFELDAPPQGRRGHDRRHDRLRDRPHLGGQRHADRGLPDRATTGSCPAQVVGTDVFHAAILLWAAGIAHIVAGNVDFGLVGAILIGSIPGVWIGSHLTVKLPTGVLRTALGVVMIAASLALFDKAGIDLPLAAMLAIPAAFAAAMVVAAHSRGRAVRATTCTRRAVARAGNAGRGCCSAVLPAVSVLPAVLPRVHRRRQPRTSARRSSVFGLGECSPPSIREIDRVADAGPLCQLAL